jgi:hypothetical protein
MQTCVQQATKPGSAELLLDALSVLALNGMPELITVLRINYPGRDGGAAAATSLQSASLTLKEVADSLKAEFVGKQDDRVLMRAGRTAAQLYAERHGRPPGKHKEMHGGRVIDVNSYTEADRDLLQEAVRQTMRKDSPSVAPFFQRKITTKKT